MLKRVMPDRASAARGDAPGAAADHGWPIAVLFSLGAGLAILLTVGSVLAVSLYGSRANLTKQLADRFDLTIDAVEARIAAHLDPAQSQVDYLVQWLSADRGVTDDENLLAEVMRGAMSATPQVVSIAWVEANGDSVRLERNDSVLRLNDLSNRSDIAATLREAERQGKGRPELGWTEPLYSPSIGQPIIVYRKAVWRGDGFAGVLFTAVSIIDLSRFTQRLSEDLQQTVFILHGRQGVIAHPNIPRIGFDYSRRVPLPALSEVDDPSLADIWNPAAHPVISAPHMERAQGHYMQLSTGFAWRVYIYSEISAYGPTPWLIGYHFEGGSVEVTRFWWMTGIGIALLVGFTAVALLLGARIARPIRQLASGAAQVESLEFASVQPLGRSPVRELDQAARSFNAMIGALRSFETYVPKRLVRRLVAAEGDGKAPTSERVVTVLFSDIVGFSALAEGLRTRQVARLLNGHFGLLNSCIEKTGGTIDKYTGDGVMAFWGAPDAQADHAARACAAAQAIAASIAKDNAKRVKRGDQPIRIRIGVHTGTVIVGDIGAAGRINYTVVGDNVNVASRLEQAAKALPQAAVADAVVVISGETREAAGAEDLACDFVARRRIKGRSKPVDIFRLV